MPTARPFAYNPGATGAIPGTEQLGDLSIGTPTEGFASTGLAWWNGPDEDPGYVIAQPVPGNNQPVQIGTGATGASVGFFRSSALTDGSFVSLSNVVAGPSGPFASATVAKTWLNDNGYWTSFEGSTGNFNVSITEVGSNVVWSGSGTLNFTGLTSPPIQASITSGYAANLGIWVAGASGNAPYDEYSGITTFPASFGSGGIGAASSTGNMFGILGSGGVRTLVVPRDYVSGSFLSGSTTYNNTISGMGLSGGTYTWSWGSGANASSMVMTIGS